MTARVRPITVMGAAAVVAVLLVGLFAWTRDDDATVVGQPASLPIMLGSGGEAAVSSVTSVAGSPTYVRGPDVADPSGARAAWTLAAGSPDPAAVRRLADALGVSGDLRRLVDMWQIGADDGANLKVQLAAGQAWNYWPGGVPEVAVVCAEPATRPTTASASGDDGSASSDISGCLSTPPPQGLPTDDEAEDATRDLLRRAGLDADVTVEVTGSEWGTTVVASPELDGTPTQGIDTVVSFGAAAAITSASGVLGSASRTDAYPLVGVDAAIDRLNAGHDVLDGLAPLAMAGSGVAYAVDGATTSADATSSASVGSTAGSSVTTVPITTVPDPSTTTSTTAPDTATTWGCAVPFDGAASEGSSSSAPVTTTTIVGVGDGDAGGSGGSSAPGCAGSVSPCAPCPSDAVCPDLCASPPCDPAACDDPYPGPTVVPEPAPDDPARSSATVTITSAEVVLAGVSGYDGSVWIVPAYRLHGDDGATYTVLGIDDAFVAPAPAPPEPATDPTAADAPTPMTAPAQPVEPIEPDAPPATFTSPGSTPCTAPWMC